MYVINTQKHIYTSLYRIICKINCRSFLTFRFLISPTKPPHPATTPPRPPKSTFCYLHILYIVLSPYSYLQKVTLIHTYTILYTVPTQTVHSFSGQFYFLKMYNNLLLLLTHSIVLNFLLFITCQSNT